MPKIRPVGVWLGMKLIVFSGNSEKVAQEVNYWEANKSPTTRVRERQLATTIDPHSGTAVVTVALWFE